MNLSLLMLISFRNWNLNNLNLYKSLRSRFFYSQRLSIETNHHQLKLIKLINRIKTN